MNINDWMPAIIAVLGGTAFWGFLTVKAKQGHELKLKESDSSGEFKDSLKERVRMLSQENKDLHTKLDQLNKEFTNLSVELAQSNERIKHLEADIAKYELEKKIKLGGL